MTETTINKLKESFYKEFGIELVVHDFLPISLRFELGNKKRFLKKHLNFINKILANGIMHV